MIKMTHAQPITSQSRTNDEIQTRNIDNTKLRQTTGTQTWPDLNLGVTIETVRKIRATLLFVAAWVQSFLAYDTRIYFNGMFFSTREYRSGC